MRKIQDGAKPGWEEDVLGCPWQVPSYPSHKDKVKEGKLRVPGEEDKKDAQ